MQLILRSVVFFVLFAAALSGCDSASCDEAAEKLESCLSQIDCSDLDPDERRKCDTARREGEDALRALQEAPACVGAAKTEADRYNQCPVRPETYCAC